MKLRNKYHAGYTTPVLVKPRQALAIPHRLLSREEVLTIMACGSGPMDQHSRTTCLDQATHKRKPERHTLATGYLHFDIWVVVLLAHTQILFSTKQ